MWRHQINEPTTDGPHSGLRTAYSHHIESHLTHFFTPNTKNGDGNGGSSVLLVGVLSWCRCVIKLKSLVTSSCYVCQMVNITMAAWIPWIQLADGSVACLGKTTSGAGECYFILWNFGYSNHWRSKWMGKCFEISGTNLWKRLAQATTSLEESLDRQWFGVTTTTSFVIGTVAGKHDHPLLFRFQNST